MQSCIEGLFPFPYANFSSLFANPRGKNTFFFHMYTPCLLYNMHICMFHHYSPCTSVFVPKNEKWCRISMLQQEIYDHWPSIYWKHSDSTLQFHLKAINGPILSYGKEEKEFNFESKVTLEKLLLHIESASLCPLSLNIVFIPQDIPLLMENLIVSFL